jgi:hypothetical protein
MPKLVRPFQGVDTFDRNVSNKIHKNLVTTRLHTSKDKPGFQARIPMSESTKMICPLPTNDIIVAAMNAKTDSSSRVATILGRNTFGTCFRETGLKIRPDVFRHDNCEQKKHVLLCKMSPASYFFLFKKGEKNNK